MSVTLRLQGLSYRTNPNDIRESFVGLDIPQDGITIIGGPKHEAIVDVASWDNAYQALQMTGLQIRNSTVQISVITSEEKQQALENFQNSTKSSANSRNGTEKKSHKKKYSYLRLNIGDLEATQEDVKHFFDGLSISDVVFSHDKDEPKNAIAMAKFDSSTDATEGFNRYKDSKLLHVIQSSEKEWIRHGGSHNNDEDDHVSRTSEHSHKKTRSRSRGRRSRSPRRRSGSHRKYSKSPRRRSRSRGRRSRSPRRRSRSPRRRSRSRGRRSRSPRRRSRSPRRCSRSPKSSSRTTLSSKSPASQSDEHDSSGTDGYHVHLTNLSYRSSKEDLKKLFKVENDGQILLMYDDQGHRTRTAFVSFTNKEDFKKATKLDKVTFKGHELIVSPTSKSAMKRYMEKNVCPQAYLYLKNFSPEVTKSDIKSFLNGFNLHDDDISLLFDKSNTSLGEAMVKFSSFDDTVQAEKLNRKTFKEREISLKRIFESRLVSFLQSNNLVMLSVDPSECVTQEDDLSEEEEAPQSAHNEMVKQNMDVCTPKEESAASQEVCLPECIAQEDE